ncbi:hypothetical protein CWI39_2822p0010 [Hamiltosporidium magnivora]|uniref:Uncharacterized protein n=1 Tax=Hamiltosporidium magnivora TaxID=148818 RepID=A0A4Q9KSB0_9MICR|nr:hypothetical protein CWI39_2822p0010 [Hamiltosporidium magnivora]
MPWLQLHFLFLKYINLVFKTNKETKTYVKIWNIRSDFFFDKKKNKNTDIEVGNIYQDLLKIVETEKLRKYDSRPMRCILFVIEERTHPLKQAKNDENAVKINIRNNTPDISGERTTCDELTININKKSDLE